MPRRLPDFIVIGAMKAGTTTLFRHLQSHPRLFMPEPKEPDFFVREKAWGKGIDWYASLFEPAPRDVLVGEGSTNYTKTASFPETPGLLHQYVPQVKLIYLLRDPVERLRSQYVHAVLSGRERRTPGEAVTADSGYVDTSLYGRQLSQYLDRFPSDQVLVVLTEDLRDRPGELLGSVETFLGVEAYPFPRLDRHDHVSSQRRANTRLAAALKSNQRFLDWSRQAVPDGVRARLKHGLTRAIDTTQVDIPRAVLDRLKPLLAADRALLSSLCELDLRAWTSLDAIA